MTRRGMKYTWEFHYTCGGISRMVADTIMTSTDVLNCSRWKDPQRIDPVSTIVINDTEFFAMNVMIGKWCHAKYVGYIEANHGW